MAIESIKLNDRDVKKISNVTFGSIQLKSYKVKESQGDEGVVTKRKVFSIEFFTDKATFKEIKKNYKKLTIEEIDTSDIDRRFHIEPHLPDSDEQYKVTMYAGAEIPKRDGSGLINLWEEGSMNLNLRPKAYKKNTQENITNNYFNNGAKGDVYFTEKTNKFATQPYFFKIDLDEYSLYEKKEA